MSAAPLPLILPTGTKIVARISVPRGKGLPEVPQGSVGVVVRAPADATHAYTVEFADGTRAALRRTEIRILKHVKSELGDSFVPADEFEAYAPYIRYRCVVGSRAFGLAGPDSDKDVRGFYLPPADLHWSLYGVPSQIERDDTQECYWELATLLTFALKANPNVLEVLWSPLVEHTTPLADELRSIRGAFLSRLVFQTYAGYTMSQFKKLEQDLRTTGDIKWKHAMHLLRLLASGIGVLRDGEVRVDAGPHRERLLAIKAGSVPWDDVDRWRLALHREFEEAFAVTRLPERPDYALANDFLVRARRSVV